MIKLDFEQRQLAGKLEDEMYRAPDLSAYAEELIVLRSSKARFPIPFTEEQEEVIKLWASDSRLELWGNYEARELNLSIFARSILRPVAAHAEPPCNANSLNRQEKL